MNKARIPVAKDDILKILIARDCSTSLHYVDPTTCLFLWSPNEPNT